MMNEKTKSLKGTTLNQEREGREEKLEQQGIKP